MHIAEARKWYRWLWLSPFLTIPTLIVVGIWSYFVDLGSATAVIVSALWHLILLIPARDKSRPFVRWHGRQALLLAGIRTAIPLYFVVWHGYIENVLSAIPSLIVIWFFGTLWGQGQAARGTCSTYSWFAGDQDKLIFATSEAEQIGQLSDRHVQDLVRTIRYGRFAEQRQKALERLETHGKVETL